MDRVVSPHGGSTKRIPADERIYAAKGGVHTELDCRPLGSTILFNYDV